MQTTSSITIDTDLKMYDLGICDYQPILEKMRNYTLSRTETSLDQIWYLQHTPVYTQGLNGKQRHVLNTHDIPLIPVDRGGQVTYHGPGQLIAYLLVDINRRMMGIKQIVYAIEQSVIDYLQDLNIFAERRTGAPGIYVGDAKIAALGLRVKNGRCYHGLSLNVDMDLSPFMGINPCGYENLPVTQIKDILMAKATANTQKLTVPTISDVKNALHPHLCQHLRYNIPIN